MQPEQQEIILLSEMNEVNIIYKRPILNEMPHVTSPSKANDIIRKVIDLDRIDHKEFSWVLLMNNSNRVLGISQISEGSTTSTVVNLRDQIFNSLKK